MQPVLTLLALAMLVCPALGQDARKVPISFLPPPLETATYSLGIYDAKSGKLVRRLQEAAPESAFTVGDNGLITSWDGKDDAGKTVPPGKYAARGYAVGELKVEGEEILGNDWTADDEELRLTVVKAMTYVQNDGGLVVFGATPSDGMCVARYDGKGKFLWQRAFPFKDINNRRTLYLRGDNVVLHTASGVKALRLSDGSETEPPSGELPNQSGADDTCPGKDGTVWSAAGGVLTQFSAHGEKLRTLTKVDDLIPVAVDAAQAADRLYLREVTIDCQRVRGLSWVETKQEDGKPVSTWQTFFERNIRPPDPKLGLNDWSTPPLEVSLAENPLDPGKPQRVKLDAKVDGAGSYLVTADGLRLRRISQRANLKTAKLVKNKSANVLTFFQNDGAAWDEFSIEGIKNMMTFDAGEFEMTGDGEKIHTEKAAEPPDL